MNSLNPEEKELLESVEKEEWESVENVSQEIKRYQTYSSHRINQQKIDKDIAEEQDIIQSFEEGEWISQGTPERLKQLQLYAKNTEEQQITLNIATQDLKSLESQAKEKGISCEKLVSIILHEYVVGQLIQKS
ncbi:MAG: hypothetical protein QNJ37_05140 [Crocosphaera sp.]|nr:hypothetical protein [Crocosphaera sp.]